MRLILISAIATALALPAFADEPTTLQFVTTKGVVMTVSGTAIPVTYTPDGKFTAMNGMVTGTWKIVGDKLCSSNNMEPNEVCIGYPPNKKPGEEFEIAGPQGPLLIKINP